MKSKVRVAASVEAFVKAQAPEPRRRLTRGIKGLARNQGDIKSLEGRLAGYWRLSVGGYRVIYAERRNGGERTVDCLFAERRAIVYEIFEKIVAQELGER